MEFKEICKCILLFFASMLVHHFLLSPTDVRLDGNYQLIDFKNHVEIIDLRHTYSFIPENQQI